MPQQTPYIMDDEKNEDSVKRKRNNKQMLFQMRAFCLFPLWHHAFSNSLTSCIYYLVGLVYLLGNVVKIEGKILNKKQYAAYEIISCTHSYCS